MNQNPRIKKSNPDFTKYYFQHGFAASTILIAFFMHEGMFELLLWRGGIRIVKKLCQIRFFIFHINDADIHFYNSGL